MTRCAVLCLRLCDTPKDPSTHLRALRRLVEEQAGHSAKLIGWGADRFSFAFPESERAYACRMANALLVELGEHAIGIALREIVSEAEASRAFGVGLVMAETLANAARPGEVLVDPEIIETPGLARLGSAVVRFGDVILRASLCARPTSVPPLSVPDPLPPLPPLTPPPKSEAVPSSTPMPAPAFAPMPMPPLAPVFAPMPAPAPLDTPSPARISVRPPSPPLPSAPTGYETPSPARASVAPVSPSPAPAPPSGHETPSPARASVAPVSPSPAPPPPSGHETPSPARISLRPASPSAPPFRSPRSVRPPPLPEPVRRVSPPPKPSLPPGDGPRRSPPPKPSLPPPREEDPDPVSGTFPAEGSSNRSATDPPLRPSVIEALRSGDASAMLALADQLRTEGAKGGLVARLEAMASLVQGEVLNGLDALRTAAGAAKQRGSKNQSRTALALAVGLSMAGKKQEALLQGLEALSLARARSDDRGALACSAFLAQLAQAVGEPSVAEAWLDHSVTLANAPSDAPKSSDALPSIQVAPSQQASHTVVRPGVGEFGLMGPGILETNPELGIAEPAEFLLVEPD